MAGPCPVCRSSDATVESVLPDRMFHLPGRFSLARCRQCRSLFLANPPADPGLYYPEAVYYSYQSTVASDTSRGWRRVLRHIAVRYRPRYRDIDSVLRSKIQGSNRRILDVGCGAGDALDFYRSGGWETWGVEPGQAAAESACARGHHVLASDFGAAVLDQSFFDLVRIRHTFEHMADPTAVVQKISSVLRQGGWLLLETPNIAGWLARCSGSSYWQLDAPRHLVLAHPHALHGILQKFGLPTVSLSTYSSAQGAAITMWYWLKAAEFRDFETGWRLSSSQRPPLHNALTMLTFPLALTSDVFKAGESLRIVARKE